MKDQRGVHYEKPNQIKMAIESQNIVANLKWAPSTENSLNLKDKNE